MEGRNFPQRLINQRVVVWGTSGNILKQRKQKGPGHRSAADDQWGEKSVANDLKFVYIKVSLGQGFFLAHFSGN